MTVKTPSPPPLPSELDRLLRRLRLPYVRRAAPDVIATATSQRWEPAEIMRVLLAEEAAGRDRATIQTRRRASKLPAGKTFDAWEPERSVIPAATQQALRTMEWIDRAETLVVCGPSGTGKSHLIEALGPAQSLSGSRDQLVVDLKRPLLHDHLVSLRRPAAPAQRPRVRERGDRPVLREAAFVAARELARVKRHADDRVPRTLKEVSV